MTDLRYPIRQFEFPTQITDGDRKGWISDIQEAPANIRKAVAGLTPDQVPRTDKTHASLFIRQDPEL